MSVSLVGQGWPLPCGALNPSKPHWFPYSQGGTKRGYLSVHCDNHAFQPLFDVSLCYIFLIFIFLRFCIFLLIFFLSFVGLQTKTVTRELCWAANNRLIMTLFFW